MSKFLSGVFDGTCQSCVSAMPEWSLDGLQMSQAILLKSSRTATSSKKKARYEPRQLGTCKAYGLFGRAIFYSIKTLTPRSTACLNAALSLPACLSTVNVFVKAVKACSTC